MCCPVVDSTLTFRTIDEQVTVGLVEVGLLGESVGDLLGLIVGLLLGRREGLAEGEVLGAVVGLMDGELVGLNVGLAVGSTDGDTDGLTDGDSDGDFEGGLVGSAVGVLLGLFEGDRVTHDEFDTNSWETMSKPQVLPRDLAAITDCVSSSSRRVALLRRHKQPVASLGLTHHRLLITTLSILYRPFKFTSQYAFLSSV